MVVLACQLATEKKSSVDALYVIEVPMNLPLDARLEEERATAAEVLQEAVTLATQFKVKMTPIVVTARSAGRAIVQQATERRSEVIILGVMKKRRFTERAFGGTVDYVVEHAPCEVLVNIVPADRRVRVRGEDAVAARRRAARRLAADRGREAGSRAARGAPPAREWTPPGVSTDQDATGD